jgi:hypothetical protein
MRYVTVRGEERAAVTEQLRERCDLWGCSEARAALRTATDRDDKLIALYATALTASTTQDVSLVEDFRAATSDPDVGVRQAVIVAAGYLP